VTAAGATAGYVVKYLPNSTTVDPTFNGGMPFAFRLNFGSLGIYDLQLRGVAVDTTPTHLIEVVGDAHNTMTNNHLAVVITISQAGAFGAGAGFGTGTDTAPYSLDGAAADGLGDVVFTGTYTGNNGSGTPSQPNFTFAFIPAGSDASGAGGFYYYFTDAMMNPVPTHGLGIAIDPAANFTYAAGTFAPAGAFTQGLAGQIPIDGVFNLTAFAQSDTTGNVVLSGAAVNNVTAVSYFSGTGPNNGGTGGIVDTIDSTFMTATGVIITDDPTNSIQVKDVAVDQNTGNVYVDGTILDPGGSGFTCLFLACLRSDLSSGLFVAICATTPTGNTQGCGVAVTSAGNLAVVGTTFDSGFSTDSTTLAGTSDGFLLSYTFSPGP
jgi:hypothetical protein